jgi:cell division control protein 11
MVSPFSHSAADSPTPPRRLSPATTPSANYTPDPIEAVMSANTIPGPKLRRKKNVKKGIQFCLMVCGASGTGRTTFVNTLCQKAVLPHLDSDAPPYLESESTGEPSVKIKPVTVELELDEEGTRVSLTIVDTPGFGDHVDNEASFGEISSYLERQYDDIVAEESRIKRNPRFRDNRVHVLLYFVQPTGEKYVLRVYVFEC